MQDQNTFKQFSSAQIRDEIIHNRHDKNDLCAQT